MNMKWKKGKSAKDNKWTCILCGCTIPKDYYYIRPHKKVGPNWSSEMVKGRGKTINQRPPCFHINCLETLGGWFGSKRPAFDNIYDNRGKVQLPLQDPKVHLPDGKPL